MRCGPVWASYARRSLCCWSLCLQQAACSSTPQLPPTCARSAMPLVIAPAACCAGMPMDVRASPLTAAPFIWAWGTPTPGNACRQGDEGVWIRMRMILIICPRWCRTWIIRRRLSCCSGTLLQRGNHRQAMKISTVLTPLCHPAARAGGQFASLFPGTNKTDQTEKTYAIMGTASDLHVGSRVRRWLCHAPIVPIGVCSSRCWRRCRRSKACVRRRHWGCRQQRQMCSIMWWRAVKELTELLCCWVSPAPMIHERTAGQCCGTCPGGHRV